MLSWIVLLLKTRLWLFKTFELFSHRHSYQMVQRAFLQSAQAHPGPTLASPWGSVSAQQDLGLGPSLTTTLVSQLPGLGSGPSKGRNHLINIHCSAVREPFPSEEEENTDNPDSMAFLLCLKTPLCAKPLPLSSQETYALFCCDRLPRKSARKPQKMSFCKSRRDIFDELIKNS